MMDDRKHVRRLLLLALLRLDSHVDEEVEKASGDLCEALLLLQPKRDPVASAIAQVVRPKGPEHISVVLERALDGVRKGGG